MSYMTYMSPAELRLFRARTQLRELPQKLRVELGTLSSYSVTDDRARVMRNEAEARIRRAATQLRRSLTLELESAGAARVAELEAERQARRAS